MPQDIVGAASWLNRYTLPVDEELADVESLRKPFQRAADNAAFLAEAVFGSGVHAIRRVADVATLRALAGPIDGTACVVAGQGLYLYASAAVAAELSPWVVAPASGLGRWVHILALLRDVPGGFAMLDAAGRVPVARVPNMLVSTAFATSEGDVKCGTTRATICSATLANIQAGDVLIADAFVQVRQLPSPNQPGPGDYTSVGLSGDHTGGIGGFFIYKPDPAPRAFHSVAKATGSGTGEVRLELIPEGITVPAECLAGAYFRVLAFRP